MTRPVLVIMTIEKLYMSERQNIIGDHGNRSKFAAFVVDAHRNQTQDDPWQLLGMWVLVPLTGQFQRTMGLWEWAEGWAGFEQTVHDWMIKPRPEWHGVYQKIDELRLGGECFVMEPGPGCPTASDLTAKGIKGTLLSYERADVAPGTEERYLEAVRSEWAPITERYGYAMVGNYIAAKVDGVVFTAWACERAAHTELVRSSEARAWRERRRELILRWQEELWVGAAGSRLAGPETVAAP